MYRYRYIYRRSTLTSFTINTPELNGIFHHIISSPVIFVVYDPCEFSVILNHLSKTFSGYSTERKGQSSG